VVNKNIGDGAGPRGPVDVGGGGGEDGEGEGGDEGDVPDQGVRIDGEDLLKLGQKMGDPGLGKENLANEHNESVKPW
jgi:hypothetical protein